MTWFPWEVRLSRAIGRPILMPRNLVDSENEINRIDETIRQYGVTHVLWGSFEPSPSTLTPQVVGLVCWSKLRDRGSGLVRSIASSTSSPNQLGGFGVLFASIECR